MTASSHFTLSCDSYKQNTFSGFSRLLEQQEFVDLTLAADGHLVKVHKNVMALTSPYIKELLKSTSSDNPVIFLNNVKHDILNYLLEYIYQGEVNIPQDCLESFFQLSQSLHINGMGKPNKSQNVVQKEKNNRNLGKGVTLQARRSSSKSTLDGTCKIKESNSNVAPYITINNDCKFEVQPNHKQISNVQGSYGSNLSNDVQTVSSVDIQAMPVVERLENNVNLGNNMEIDLTMSQDDQTNAVVDTEQTSMFPIIQILSDSKAQSEESEQTSMFPIIQILNDSKVQSEESGLIDLNQPISLDNETREALRIISQYSVTERGSVQIIVNRYIYFNHHSSRGGRKRRWRCADYRRLRCPAFIDSLDDRIVSRAGAHIHAFHDDKIYKKHQLGNIFHTFKQAENAAKIPKPCSIISMSDIDIIEDYEN